MIIEANTTTGNFSVAFGSSKFYGELYDEDFNEALEWMNSDPLGFYDDIEAEPILPPIDEIDNNELLAACVLSIYQRVNREGDELWNEYKQVCKELPSDYGQYVWAALSHIDESFNSFFE